MASLSELLAQKQELDRAIAEAQRQERSDAIAKVRELMQQHGLTAADLVGKAPARASGGAKSAGKVAAKYRHPQTGDTWSGRGLRPKWLRAALDGGAQLSDFAI